MNHKERGYTTIELMVAISLSLIFIGFVYSVYHFSIRLTRSWDEKICLEDQVLICMDRLNRDLIAASEIKVLGADTLAVIVRDKQIGYRIRKGVLYRNGFRIHSDKIVVTEFKVKRDAGLQPDDFQLSESKSVSAQLSGENRDERPIFTIRLSAAGSKKQLTLNSVIRPRNADQMIYETL
jgi:hypothetical protein